MSDSRDFTQGIIIKKLISFMVPVLGALFLQAMYGAVDILIVSWFGTDPGISGVSTGSNITGIVTFTVSAFAMAVTVLIGQYLGEKRSEKVSKVIGGAILFFLIAAVVVSILTIIFAKDLADLMKSPKEANKPNTTLTLIGLAVPLSSLFGIIINTIYFIIFRRKTREQEIQIV